MATPIGAPLKDALVSHLREDLGIDVKELGTGFAIATDVGRQVSSLDVSEARGLVVCSSDLIGSILTN